MSNRDENVDAILARYRSAAVRHGEGTVGGNHIKANDAHFQLNEAFKALCARGPDAEARLLELLDDDIASVRLWAAAHCLELNEARAKSVLAAMARERGPSRFDASMVLQEWCDGKLRFRKPEC